MRSLGTFCWQWRGVWLAGLISFLLLWWFHDVAWWQRDDGVFAHLAKQVYEGAVFGVGVFDFHGGYHHLLNALMFQWFGVDMVVLRYPIIVIGAMQAMLIAALLRVQTTTTAVAAGVASVSLGFLLYPNPSPNWYALFFAIVAVALLTTFQRSRYVLFGVGLVVGLCFMFRHPSAVFLAMGVVVYLVATPQMQESKSTPFGRFLLGIVAFAILLYSFLVFEPLAFVLLSVPPLSLLWWLWGRPLAGARELLGQGVLLAAGFMAALLPMVVYQLGWGALSTWFHAAFISGSSIIGKAFFDDVTYASFITESLGIGWAEGGLPGLLAFGGYHLLLFALPLLVLGVWWLRRRSRRDPLPPVVAIALCYGLVSFYYQVPFYFHISVPLFLLAVLMLYVPQSRLATRVLATVLVLLNIMALAFGAPGVERLIYPERFVDASLPRVSLSIDPKSHETVLHLLAVIERETKPTDALFVFPHDPEFYFLSDRRPAFPFMGTSFAVTNESDLQSLREDIARLEIPLIIYSERNSYGSQYDVALAAWLDESARYTLVANHEGYRFYSLSRVSADADTD